MVQLGWQGVAPSRGECCCVTAGCQGVTGVVGECQTGRQGVAALITHRTPHSPNMFLL